MELVEFEDIDELEAIELRGLIAEHAQRTGSPVAERVLGSWETLLPRFVKVMPRDYKARAGRARRGRRGHRRPARGAAAARAGAGPDAGPRGPCRRRSGDRPA